MSRDRDLLSARTKQNETDIEVMTAQRLAATMPGAYDHGALSGLSDDDHAQYHTDARGDARYPPLAHVGAGGVAHADAVAAGAAGFMTGADKTKLDGIAAGATVNSSDATLLARANHTGTQPAATVSDFDAQVRTSRLDQMAAPSASVAFADQQATSFRVENRTSDPGTPTTGQIWLRTDL